MLEVVERQENEIPPVNNARYAPTYTAIAGLGLSSARVVSIINGTAVYYNPMDVGMYGLITGLTMTSAVIGGKIEIQLSGAFYESGLGLEQGKEYFAGPDGTITVNPAGLKLVQSIGNSIDSNTLNLNINSPIETL